MHFRETFELFLMRHQFRKNLQQGSASNEAVNVILYMTEFIF